MPQCEECGTALRGRRRHARHCSPRCRTAAWRRRKQWKAENAPGSATVGESRDSVTSPAFTAGRENVTAEVLFSEGISAPTAKSVTEGGIAPDHTASGSAVRESFPCTDGLPPHGQHEAAASSSPQRGNHPRPLPPTAAALQKLAPWWRLDIPSRERKEQVRCQNCAQEIPHGRQGQLYCCSTCSAYHQGSKSPLVQFHGHSENCPLNGQPWLREPREER